MQTIRRLGPYFRPLLPKIWIGIALTALNAVFSGFSIALVLPIIQRVFMRSGPAPEPGPPPPRLPATEGEGAGVDITF